MYLIYDLIYFINKPRICFLPFILYFSIVQRRIYKEETSNYSLKINFFYYYTSTPFPCTCHATLIIG